MILIPYRRLRFNLRFEKPIIFQNLPSFYFRSVLGLQLKRLVCIFRNRPCDKCALRFSCAYSMIFETPLKEDQKVLPSINYGSHPFLIFTDVKPGQVSQNLQLTLTLIGEAHTYIPMIFMAIKNGGESGLFKSRIKYAIEQFFIDGYIALNREKLIIPSEIPNWEFDERDQRLLPGKLFIEFLSPFRFKKNGKYTDKISLDDILLALNRRLRIIIGLYAKQPLEDFEIFSLPHFKHTAIFEENNRLQWVDYSRYSARQKTSMKMGGVEGILSLQGKFDARVLKILEGGEIFHIGKNTSLGLGKIKSTFIERKQND